MRGAELELRLRVAEAVAREAGYLALRHFRRRDALVVEAKGLQDFVSAADQEAERLIVERLLAAFPEDGVVGEEGAAANGTADALWVIDPIDGTRNFLAGLSAWCVSIGLLVGGEPAAGVIHAPVEDQLYSAARGFGAYLDGHPIRASGERDLRRARVGLGFSYRRPPAMHAAAVSALLEAGCEYARFGSGALGLAWTAAGIMDGYHEAHMNAWDAAAGLAIAREAGAWVSDFFAGDGLARGAPVLVATPELVPDLRRLLGFDEEARGGEAPAGRASAASSGARAM